MRIHRFLVALTVCLFCGFGQIKSEALPTTSSAYDLVFDDLSKVWDEAMPMGNGCVGALLWQKGNSLRVALDRSDLWDLRPLGNFSGENFRFDWVYEHVVNKDYGPVHRQFQLNAKNNPGTTKIPGAALEIDISKWGPVEENHLFLHQGLTQITWKSGRKMQWFVHATKPVGWFVLDNMGEDFDLSLIPPLYDQRSTSKANDHSDMDLVQLGYTKGTVVREANKMVYEQQCWGELSYQVAVKWQKKGNRVVGVWSVTSSLVDDVASKWVDKALKKGVDKYYQSHCQWWNNFYAQSSIDIPDELLAKQYMSEIYKMGCLARENSYPISLQGLWTADNGRKAPWSGDYHHDLNTQLSYWPFYASNHLSESASFVNTLWNQRETHKQYTRTYFGTNGLNVPGVCSLTGEPMGSWVQYSLSPTVSSWLAHHFYLQWQYSQDRAFLKKRAYPYIKDVATYLEETTIVKEGVRTLRLSSSPEFHDNSLSAWFLEMTNFDRSLVKFTFKAAAEMAEALGLEKEAAHWMSLYRQLPDFLCEDSGALLIAPGFPYQSSHRHFSHLLGIHPLGLIDKSHGEKESRMIDASIGALDKYGTQWWCGYSFSWLASLKARAFDGEGAAQALRDFAECFCLRNTFHANGDQKKCGKSNFTYRPFTLEGNMAFAAGLQEMLIQSHTGVIVLFPAVPKDWKNVSFRQLRTVGAFLVTASMENGKLSKAKIVAEHGGLLRLKVPVGVNVEFKGKSDCITVGDGEVRVQSHKGETLNFVFK